MDAVRNLRAVILLFYPLNRLFFEVPSMSFKMVAKFSEKVLTGASNFMIAHKEIKICYFDFVMEENFFTEGKRLGYWKLST